jgi:hypothetical protein
MTERVGLSVDEDYPVYGLEPMDDCCQWLDVPEDLIARFRLAEGEWRWVQAQLQMLITEQGFSINYRDPTSVTAEEMAEAEKKSKELWEKAREDEYQRMRKRQP